MIHHQWSKFWIGLYKKSIHTVFVQWTGSLRNTTLHYKTTQQQHPDTFPPTIEARYFWDKHFFWTCHYKIIKKKILFAQSSYKIMSNNTMLVIWLPQGRDRLVDGSVGEHLNPGEQKALSLGCSCSEQWIPGTAGLVLTSSRCSNGVPLGATL